MVENGRPIARHSGANQTKNQTTVVPVAAPAALSNLDNLGPNALLGFRYPMPE
jgi:hypothetical protein